jgi:hypothetical protein
VQWQIQISQNSQLAASEKAMKMANLKVANIMATEFAIQKATTTNQYS